MALGGKNPRFFRAVATPFSKEESINEIARRFSAAGKVEINLWASLIKCI